MAEDTPTDLEGSSMQIGEYTVLQEIKQARYYKLFLGKHVDSEQIVAIKQYHPDHQQQYQNELETLSHAKSPYIANLIETVAEDRANILEYASGGTMLNLIQT